LRLFDFAVFGFAFVAPNAECERATVLVCHLAVNVRFDHFGPGVTLAPNASGAIDPTRHVATAN
jgi:hypothetical protein